MPSHTSGDPSFYAKKRAKEAELGRELSTEEFLADHYAASEAADRLGHLDLRSGAVRDRLSLVLPAGRHGARSLRRRIGARHRRLAPGARLSSASSFAASRSRRTGRSCIWRESRRRSGFRATRGTSRRLPRMSTPIWCFCCPPYWNLEVYSDDPADLSTMGREAFFEAYAEIIAGAVARLKEDRFAVWVIGDVRDAKGFFVNLPGRTVEAFEAAGARFYNDAILVDRGGLAADPRRAAVRRPRASSAAPTRTCWCSARAIRSGRPQPAGRSSSARSTDEPTDEEGPRE